MRRMLVVAALLALSAPLAACAGETDDGVVRLIPLGSTAYITGWDASGDEGDQAQVERKQLRGEGDKVVAEAWVIPTEASYRYARGGDYVVKVRLTNDGKFQVLDMGGVKVGEDHDACLEDGEAYVEMKVAPAKLKWEPAVPEEGTPNDDCERDPNAENDA